MSMRFGLSLHPFERYSGVAPLIETAKLAEDLGFDTVVLGEHVVVPRELERQLGRTWYDPLTLAAAIAMQTRRVRLFLFLALPHHHPLVLAKAIATLDQVSGGRITIGAGLGSVREEAALLHVPWRERGPRTDECIRAMASLWTEPAPAFHGSFFHFDRALCDPRPVQQPHPPIWIGGSGPCAWKRAADLGQGYYPAGADDDHAIEAGMRALREELRSAHRDPARFSFARAVQWDAGAGAAAGGIDGGSPPEMAGRLERAAAAGLTDVIVRMPAPDLATLHAGMSLFREQVIRRLHEGAPEGMGAKGAPGGG